MELRSYNVERLYMESVKGVLVSKGSEVICINKEALHRNVSDIKDMLSQIRTSDGFAHLCACNIRKDGEMWTPYLQIVEMLIRMGSRIGCVKYDGRLKPESLIKIELL